MVDTEEAVQAVIQGAIERAREASKRGDFKEAWAAVEPLRAGLTKRPVIALAWLSVMRADPEGGKRESELAEIIAAFPNEPMVVILACSNILARIDGRPADEPIPADDPAFRAMKLALDCIESLPAELKNEPELAGRLGIQLACAYRLAGPKYDAEAESTYKRVIELRPEDPWWHFDLGLLYKNRGRFAEAAAVFRRVRELGGDQPPILWNLAITSTGAGDGATALEAWRALGLEATLGSDGLPKVAGLADVKVRLSTRVLLEPLQDPPAPVEFDEVWVRPSSPCHGVVLNPPNPGIHAAYDDIVLWDGQPLGPVQHKGQTTYRFASLGRLSRGQAKSFNFVAQSATARDVEALNDTLPDAVWFYVRKAPATGEAAGRVEGALIVEPESTPDEAARLVRTALAEAKLDLAIADLG